MSLPTALPEYSHIRNGYLDVRSEEEAAVWLWAQPELLQWHAPIEWLLSPVTGNRKWPGDLWGIDAEGELLIVENKMLGGGKQFDPFADFHWYAEESRSQCAAEDLRRTWKRLYGQEIKYSDPLAKRTTTAGILPRSVHRSRLSWWPELATKIGAHIQSGEYRRNVEEYLARRQGANAPGVHYCGVLVSDRPHPNVSPRIMESMGRLQEHVGTGRVHLFAIAARVCDLGVEIHAMRMTSHTTLAVGAGR